MNSSLPKVNSYHGRQEVTSHFCVRAKNMILQPPACTSLYYVSDSTEQVHWLTVLLLFYPWVCPDKALKILWVVVLWTKCPGH